MHLITREHLPRASCNDTQASGRERSDELRWPFRRACRVACELDPLCLGFRLDVLFHGRWPNPSGCRRGVGCLLSQDDVHVATPSQVAAAAASNRITRVDGSGCSDEVARCSFVFPMEGYGYLLHFLVLLGRRKQVSGRALVCLVCRAQVEPVAVLEGISSGRAKSDGGKGYCGERGRQGFRGFHGFFLWGQLDDQQAALTRSSRLKGTFDCGPTLYAAVPGLHTTREFQRTFGNGQSP